MNVKKLLRCILISKKEKKLPVEKPLIRLTPYEKVRYTAEERFHHSYKINELGCWIWQKQFDTYGYGKFKVDGRTVKAHRYSYEIYHGKFDSQLHVLHQCDCPSCVNPHHLFLGTNRDNVEDRTAKDRQGETTRRLTLSERNGIIADIQHGLSKKEISIKYQVHPSTVGRLKHGKRP